jgi:hypothetical protein
MKIKKNTFCTSVLDLFFPSIANCRKLKIQKNPKIDFPYYISPDQLIVELQTQLSLQRSILGNKLFLKYASFWY